MPDAELVLLKDTPRRLREEIKVASLMFEELAKFDNSGDVTLGAYVVAFRADARSLFIVQDLMNARAPGKDAIEVLAVACVMEGADAIVLVSETWSVQGVDPQEILRWSAEHGGLRDHPNVREMLAVTYHVTEGDWVASAPIARADHSPPTLGEWSVLKQPGVNGSRFASFYAKAQMIRAEDS